MFGNNPVRKVTHDGRNLAVQEIFYTVQGEGPLAGSPAVFVRLAGCNLACTFCDTEFESGITNLRTIPEIINEVNIAAGDCKISKRGVDLVVITGGEPLRQPLNDLIHALIANGTKRIQIETAGTLWQPELEAWIRNHYLMLVTSPKTPNVHPEIANFCNHWKYVITQGMTDREDGLPNMGTQKANMLLKQRIFRPWDINRPNEVEALDQIWISPCDAHDAEKTAANIKEAARITMAYGYRLSLQMHKIVGLR